MTADSVLLAVVEVHQDRRVRCQAPGCMHSVFRRIHIVRSNDAIHVYDTVVTTIESALRRYHDIVEGEILKGEQR